MYSTTSSFNLDELFRQAEARGFRIYIGTDCRVHVQGKQPPEKLIELVRQYRFEILLRIADLTADERLVLSTVEYDLAVSALLFRRTFGGTIEASTLMEATHAPF